MRFSRCVPVCLLIQKSTYADAEMVLEQLLTIMSSSIAYLTSRANLLQVNPDVPITKSRPPEKYDTPEVFEGASAAWP